MKSTTATTLVNAMVCVFVTLLATFVALAFTCTSQAEAKTASKTTFDVQVSDVKAPVKKVAAKIIADNAKQTKASSKTKTVSTKTTKSKSASKKTKDKTKKTGSWKSGKASAYGGSTDPGCGPRTATGAKVTESSMGVAIPMSWSGYWKYYGKKIEIKYGSKTVIATINDCGGLCGGSRALDLQPGVWRALGFKSCNGWGVRTVKYRFID